MHPTKLSIVGDCAKHFIAIALHSLAGNGLLVLQAIVVDLGEIVT
jgi:hypothetical protein